MMRGSQVLYDGLSRCLCPGIDSATFRRVLSSTAPMPGQSTRSRQLLPSKRSFPIRRQFSRLNRAIGIIHKREHSSTPKQTPLPKAPSNNLPIGETILAPTPPTEKTLRNASVDDIASALITIRDPRGWNFHGQEIDRHGRIIQLVRHLVAERGQPPSPFIYECMMDAMVDPKGSVKGIRKLLEDMESQNLKPTATMCHSALAALANHPDYALRQEILDIMQEFWFTIDTPAKQSVVLGLLRDEQYELAYTRLTELMDQKARVDIWVYDVFIMVFGKLGFIDEMLQLLYRRKNAEATDEALTSMLYYVLDVCSGVFHYPGTLFAWNGVVRNSLLQAADGIVENVLATAARHGDTALATEALDLLSQRTRVLSHHYEAVAEAFAASDDVAGAFRILSIMKQSGIRIGRANTRAIHEAIRRKPQLINDAEKAVRNLSSDQDVPVAAVAVIVEAIAESRGSEAAMDLYRDLHTLCGEQTNAALMQTLIIHSRDPPTTSSVARDYTAQVAEGDDPVRDPEVYRVLIPACADAGEMDLAFRFANQAMELGTACAEDLVWVKGLIERAMAAEDSRIWGVVDELCRDGNGVVADGVTKLLQRMRITRKVGSIKVGRMIDNRL